MSPAPFELRGKTALVTGATRGLGQAIAIALARAGADIVAVSTSQPAAGSQTQQLVEAEGRAFSGIGCDFSSRSETHRLAQRLDDEARIDILVNNAGTIHRTPALDHADDDWDRVLEVNLTAPFVLTRSLARPMIARGAGKIIFVSSILGYQGGITVPAYTASKSAIIGLTKALANEWAAAGVNVNAIAPGYVETDNTMELRQDGHRATAIEDRIPAGRWGRPDDVSGAAVFLASPASDYLHGSVLTIDGGWLSR